MRMTVRYKKCSGCLACEVACSFRQEGTFAPERARIRVSKREAEGLDQPLVCRQCKQPACVAGCPDGNLRQDDMGIVKVVNPLSCPPGCRRCGERCPLGAVFFAGDSAWPLICDLCGGEPACVARCAVGAIDIHKEVTG